MREKKFNFKKDRKIGNILSSDIWIFDKAHLKYKTVKKRLLPRLSELFWNETKAFSAPCLSLASWDSYRDLHRASILITS